MKKITVLDEDYSEAQKLSVIGTKAAEAKLASFEEEAGKMASECYSGMGDNPFECAGFMEIRNDPRVKRFLSEGTAKSISSKIRSGFPQMRLDEAVSTVETAGRFIEGSDDFDKLEEFYRGADIKKDGSDLVVTKSKSGSGSQILEAYSKLRSDLFCMMQDPKDYDEESLKNVLEGMMICLDAAGVQGIKN